MPRKPEVNQKTVIKARWCDIYFFQIRRIQTRNLGFKPGMMRWILSQIFISRNKKWKNWHFISQLIVFNVKIWFFFQALSVTGHAGNYFKRTQTISYHMRKPFDDISNLWPVIWPSIFVAFFRIPKSEDNFTGYRFYKVFRRPESGHLKRPKQILIYN